MPAKPQNACPVSVPTAAEGRAVMVWQVMHFNQKNHKNCIKEVRTMNGDLVLVQREIPRAKGELLPQMPFLIDYAKAERIRQETAALVERVFGRAVAA